MPNEQKPLVLRYAQLIFLKQLGGESPQNEDEMKKIRVELGLDHRQIMELAAQNVIDEFDC